MRLKEIIVLLAFFLASSLSSPIGVSNDKNAVKLSYTCERVIMDGKKEDLTPILLVHGVGGNKKSWRGVSMVLSMKTGRKVCAPDLRNHGASPWSDVSDIDTMASDLNLLLESLNVEKVILLGHSLGGKISSHFALKNPEKVEKLIVEDMRPNGVTDQALKEVSFLLKLLDESLSVIPRGVTEKEAKLAVFKYIKEVLQKVNNTFVLDESIADSLPIKCSESYCNFTVNVKVFRKYFETDKAYFTQSTGLFDKPALFIYGSKSPFKVGEDKEAILKLFPKAKLLPIEGVGHIVHVKREFTDEVIKFINLEEE